MNKIVHIIDYLVYIDLVPSFDKPDNLDHPDDLDHLIGSKVTAM